MRKFIGVLMILILCVPVLIAADADVSADSVSVYSGASAGKAGRALDRQNVLEISLEEFLGSRSVRTGSDGIATAIIVDEKVKNAVEKLLDKSDYTIIEGSVLARNSDYDRVTYSFIWEQYGFEIEFAFEKADKLLLAEIEKVYGDDAWLYGELMRSYDDNYVIRVFKAENLIDPEEDKIDFIEAMISATVIGSTFQPLLGIHDGLGVLDDLGLAVARSDVIESDDYIEYRRYESNSEELQSFMHTINGMSGDFIDNLYSSVASISKKHSEDNKILLPEDFFSMREGDNTDFAFFYYDILKRNGYQVKFVVIDSGSGELYSTVFFREKGTDLWGIIDGNTLERETAENWRRLPALVFTASVQYFEPDLEDIIAKGKIDLPLPSAWNSSLY